MPLESKMVTRGIANAQAEVESRNFEIRKNVLKYDDVLNRQREVVYEERRRVLEGEDLAEQVQGFIDELITGLATAGTASGVPEDWDLEQLWTDLKTVYPVSITIEDVEDEAGNRTRITAEQLITELTSDAKLAYAQREADLGEQVMRDVERRVVLSVLDRKWREHLYEMDYLKEGIGLRAMAQRDPLVEYQREGFQLYEAMTEGIKEESIGFLFNLELKTVVAATSEDEEDEEAAAATAKLGGPTTPQQLQYSAPGEAGSDEAQVKTVRNDQAGDGQTFEGTPRNAQCPCGSGEKYKRCHGKNVPVS